MPARIALSGGPAWALVGASTLMAAGLALTGWQLLETREALGQCRGKIESADDKASENAEAVEIVRDRLVACLDDHTADLQAQRDADRAYNQRIQQLSRAVAQQRAERDRLYETDDDCARWRACRVCDPIADSLRQSAGSAEDESGGNTQADPSADRR